MPQKILIGLIILAAAFLGLLALGVTAELDNTSDRIFLLFYSLLVVTVVPGLAYILGKVRQMALGSGSQLQLLNLRAAKAVGQEDRQTIN